MYGRGSEKYLMPSTENAFAPVSVVIPCYNCASTIERAVHSVMSQTLPPAEVILVNDGSTDSTLRELQRLRDIYSERNVKIIDLGNNYGPGHARNAGWESSTQPYIAFLDADDTWHPKKVEIQYNWMREHPEVVMTGHDCVWIKSPKDEQRYLEIPAVFDVQKVGRSIIWSNVLSTRSIMLKRDLPFRFKSWKKYSEDYLLWLEIILGGLLAFKIRLPLAFLYKAPYGVGGLSGRLWEMEKGELETYWLVYREGLLSRTEFLMACSLSLVKYFRRVIFCGVRRFLEDGESY